MVIKRHQTRDNFNNAYAGLLLVLKILSNVRFINKHIDAMFPKDLSRALSRWLQQLWALHGTSA